MGPNIVQILCTIISVGRDLGRTSQRALAKGEISPGATSLQLFYFDIGGLQPPSPLLYRGLRPLVYRALTGPIGEGKLQPKHHERALFYRAWAPIEYPCAEPSRASSIGAEAPIEYLLYRAYRPYNLVLIEASRPLLISIIIGLSAL